VSAQLRHDLKRSVHGHVGAMSKTPQHELFGSIQLIDDGKATDVGHPFMV
tara:strand:- start:280 stop:429 length:150 start_codon:yes stop_codon:yes gene_type:complete